MTSFTVANLKGGVGKTTTAVLLSLGLAAEARTLLVDTDPQQSALKWAQLAEDAWPWDRLTVISCTTPKTLGRQIDAIRSDHDHLVIDVPPNRDRGGARDAITAATMEAALMATGHLIVPTSPSSIDLSEIGDTFEVAADIDARRDVYASVLLIRVLLSARSANDARDILAEFGFPVMKTVIPAREHIAQAFGTVPTLSGPFAAYADALAEIRADHDQEA